MTQDETQKICESLRLIYGRDLEAATVTVLLKDGDTAVRFVISTFPQQLKESKNDTR
jgi:hypothetical protein